MQINLTERITNVVCAEGGVLNRKSRIVVKEIEPVNVMDSAAFMYGGVELFSQLSCRLAKRDIYRTVAPKGKMVITKQLTVDGERSVVENAETMVIGQAFEGEVTFSLPSGNRIFGLGQHEGGVYDYRGQSEYLVQNNMKIPMPVFLCVGKGGNFAVVFDAGCLMKFEERDGTARVWFDAVDCINYYIITGNNMDELVRGIRRLTGAAALLPKWAYGYMQSKERYKTQDEVLETARKFRELGIPLSCIIQDWSTWGKGMWGNKRADRERFPDITAMIGELHGMDVAFMVSIWPNPSTKSEDNAELAEIGGLLSNATTYDAFNAEARAVYWKQCENEWFAAGTDAWWCDSTEPFTPDWNGAVKKPDAERYEMSREKLTTFLDAREANEYALAHAQGIFENQRAACGDKRVVNLTRSGYLGIQRYGAILWSGDIAATWDVMRKQIADGLNMCASGIPWWSVDIGAFFVGSDAAWQRWNGGHTERETPWFWAGDYEGGVADEGYRELYTRWLQWGAFMPIMRSHGTDTPREPWNFGAAGDVYYDTIVKYVKLRCKMLPYVYSLAGAVWRDGYTVMRNLNFDFSDDEEACGICDQYMFGPAFMVCPVLEAGAKERDVYLPRGRWYDYWTKGYIEGGRAMSVKTDITEMPVFVRAGSIVPTANGIEVYSGADGRFTAYYDNGTDYAYENGDYAAVTYVWDDAAQKLGVAGVEGAYGYPEGLEVTVYK
jgi:alpha-D-xyloside xylohydrolase